VGHIPTFPAFTLPLGPARRLMGSCRLLQGGSQGDPDLNIASVGCPLKIEASVSVVFSASSA